jgi:hypothetical protein
VPSKREVEQQRDDLRGKLEDAYNQITALEDRIADALGLADDDEDDDADEDGGE